MEPQNNYKPSQVFPKFIVGLFLFGLGLWIGRYVALPFFPTASQPKYQVLNKLYSKDNVDFATFWEAWDKLNSTYLNKKDLSGNKLVQGAIQGMISAAGDPYTNYFSPDANQSFNDELSGTFEGVGMELGAKNGKLVVIAPLDDSPASKAGIKAGDQIISIDGKDASKYTIADAVSKIRGKAGTKIKLQILREGVDKPIDLELTRAKISVKSVKEKIVGDTAVVTVTRFGDTTRQEWDEVVNDLMNKGIKKIAIDLRNDPGGRLDTAIYIGGDFLTTKDVVVQQEDSDGKRQQFDSDKEGRLQDDKVVVLINKGSASASEIVTGALRDHKIAKTVGETSFGKGTVQAVTDLKDGSGLHITIGKWLTPNGDWIHGKGITPDYKVDLSDQDIASGADPQLQKALDLLK
ncbi:MAG TPA: S41 family peptidase [Candidatus Saccharimonadales bacterium]|nr:S41 family peptidase [Candidatus Saccharimonadales bacterium]